MTFPKSYYPATGQVNNLHAHVIKATSISFLKRKNFSNFLLLTPDRPVIKVAI